MPLVENHWARGWEYLGSAFLTPIIRGGGWIHECGLSVLILTVKASTENQHVSRNDTFTSEHVRCISWQLGHSELDVPIAHSKLWLPLRYSSDADVARLFRPLPSGEEFWPRSDI